jgi:hypothetical protein
MSKTKTPTSIKDYLKSLSGVKEVVQWIKKEVMNDRSRSYIRKTILFSICVIICQSLVSYGIGKVFSMLYLRNLFGVTISIGSVGAFFLAQKLFERKMAKSREWILGIHWGNMDARCKQYRQRQVEPTRVARIVFLRCGTGS